jgi:hypothetical protein
MGSTCADIFPLSIMNVATTDIIYIVLFIISPP